MDYMLFAQAVEESAQQGATSPDLLIPIVASAFGGAIISSIVAVLLKVHDSKAEQRKRAEDLAHEREKREEDFEEERKKRAEELKSEHQKWVRAEKLAVYAEFGSLAMSTMNKAGIASSLEDAKESRNKILTLTSQIRIIAPTPISAASTTISNKLNALIQLGIKRPPEFNDERQSLYRELQTLLDDMKKDLGNGS